LPHATTHIFFLRSTFNDVNHYQGSQWMNAILSGSANCNRPAHAVANQNDSFIKVQGFHHITDIAAKANNSAFLSRRLQRSKITAVYHAALVPLFVWSRPRCHLIYPGNSEKHETMNNEQIKKDLLETRLLFATKNKKSTSRVISNASSFWSYGSLQHPGHFYSNNASRHTIFSPTWPMCLRTNPDHLPFACCRGLGNQGRCTDNRPMTLNFSVITLF